MKIVKDVGDLELLVLEPGTVPEFPLDLLPNPNATTSLMTKGKYVVEVQSKDYLKIHTSTSCSNIEAMFREMVYRVLVIGKKNPVGLRPSMTYYIDCGFFYLATNYDNMFIVQDLSKGTLNLVIINIDNFEVVRKE